MNFNNSWKKIENTKYTRPLPDRREGEENETTLASPSTAMHVTMETPQRETAGRHGYNAADTVKGFNAFWEKRAEKGFMYTSVCVWNII